MSNLVFFGVLLGAFLHAGWNALLKSSEDKVLEIALVCAAAAAISLPFLPVFPLPAAASWPYLIASAATECVYFRLLAAAYHTGDMSTVYPLMRGTAPVLVAVFGTLALGEHLSPHGWLAVLAIGAGVVSLVFSNRSGVHGHSSAVLLALANAGVIATYTTIDGIGVRLSGSPIAYGLWIFVLLAIPVLLWVFFSQGRQFVAYARKHARTALFGGAATTAAYLLALFAMTQAPIALVAALRETSILIALVIAALFLRERLNWIRCVAGVLIACGAIAIRLA